MQRAILQARREADLLYLLVVKANTAVLEDWDQRRREYVFLLGCLIAEMNGTTKNRVEQPLRMVVLLFLNSVLRLEGSIAQLVTERLSGQPVLFRDAAGKLAEQHQMATEVSKRFNKLAHVVGAAEMNLEELQNSLQSEIDRSITIWVELARAVMLDLFGTAQETRSALDQAFLLCEPNSGVGNNGADA